MRDHGFSLAEALVGMLLFLAVSGAVFAVALPDVRLAQAGPAAADLQQRARVSAAALDADLGRAGAGFASGPFAGSLARHVAAVLPRRIGPGSPDGPRAVRADAISIVAAADGGHTLLANALSSDLTLTLSPGASCPPARPFCGFAVGDLLLVLSADGSWSALDVEAIGADTGIVSAWQGSLTRDYAAGSGVIGAEIRTYYFDAARRELRQTIQNSASLPLVDAVTGVRFTYYGDPRPPTRPRPPAGTANCLYDAAGNPAPLAVLGADPLALIELPLSLFADGPWCGSGDFEYDADLLRVRRIGVRIDLEAVVEWLRADRGPTALSSVADYGLSIGITPPNLGAAR